MKQISIVLLLWCVLGFSRQSPRTIHVYVALCDNENQGIVRVPATLGNGTAPATNLYWGAMYGLRTFLKRSPNWEHLGEAPVRNKKILMRSVFRHKTSHAILIADAWRGDAIADCTDTFLKANAGMTKHYLTARFEDQPMLLKLDGKADLRVYVGHNGLMDFSAKAVKKADDVERSAMVFCCKSAQYFSAIFDKLQVKEIAMTTGFMAPEAYVLDAAVDAWVDKKTVREVRRQTAKAYAKYQKCSVRAAERLFAVNEGD